MTPRRFRQLRRKIRLALAGLFGGYALACSPSPGEMPPLAPRPEPTQPLPGAPDPLAPKVPTQFPPSDAGTPPGAPPPISAPGFHATHAVDAGVDGELPPIPDGGVPADAPAVPATNDGGRR
jgi:hypothetical protein